jgi:hypothetical protein
VTSVFEIDLDINDVLEIQSGCFDLMLYVVERLTHLVCEDAWRCVVRAARSLSGDI